MLGSWKYLENDIKLKHRIPRTIISYALSSIIIYYTCSTAKLRKHHAEFIAKHYKLKVKSKYFFPTNALTQMRVSS